MQPTQPPIDVSAEKPEAAVRPSASWFHLALVALMLGNALLWLDLLRLIWPRDFPFLLPLPGIADAFWLGFPLGLLGLWSMRGYPRVLRFMIRGGPLLLITGTAAINLALWTSLPLWLLCGGWLALVAWWHVQLWLRPFRGSWKGFLLTLNGLLAVYIYLDLHFVSVTGHHVSLIHLWQLQYGYMAHAAGITQQTVLLFLRQGAWAGVPMALFVFFFRRPFPPLDRPAHERHESFGFLAILLLLLHIGHFSTLVASRPIQDYLSFRIDARFLPLPEPSLFRRPELADLIAPFPVPLNRLDSQTATFAWTRSIARETPYNIVFLVVESWRPDLMEEFMPRVRARAERNLWLRAHQSQSNLTLSSLYSLYYGLHIVDLRKVFGKLGPPAFFEFLKRSGYARHWISSHWGEDSGGKYRDFSIVRICPPDPGFSAEMVLAEVLKALRQPGPHFIDAYLFNTHFNYFYPPNFEEFLPVLAVDHPVFLINPRGPDLIGLVNRYKNALRGLDHALDSFFLEIERSGLDRQTIFVLLGDHGQSLGESGFLVHASGPVVQQFHVPCIFILPSQQTHRITSLTQHLDIIPLLGSLIGFRVTGWQGGDFESGSRRALIQRDESVPGRMIVRRKDGMTLFEPTWSGKMQWRLTLCNSFNLDKRFLSWYHPSGVASLARRIANDRDALLKALTSDMSNHPDP